MTMTRPIAGFACMLLLGAAHLASGAATAQSCATAPDPSAPHLRALTGICGTAAFPVTASERQGGELSLVVVRGQAYVRTLRLFYGDGATRTQAEIRLHRLLGEGEASPRFATSRDGLALVSVVIDTAPPGSGADAVLLALSAGGGRPLSTGSLQSPTGRVTALAADEWVLAGSANANLAARRDIIEIGRQKGRFEMLVLSMRGRDLPVQSVQVIPFDAQPFTVDLNTTLTTGALSVPIVLDPPDFVRAIQITYGTPSALALQRATVVEVRGRQTEAWGGQLGENRQYAGGWLLLGTVDVIATPHQARPPLQITGRDGKFKKVRFVARRGAIDLVGATVEAGDGRSETLAVNSVLVPGQPSTPVGFANGATLPISSVRVMPRLHTQSRVDATLEVWAQY